MQVDGGQPRELDTCLALFFQYKDVPEVTTRAQMKLPQATEVPKPMQTLAPDVVGL
jgi:hypothetical protein